MSKFTYDKNGIMGLTLSQIGLIIASVILLAAIFTIIFQNDWQKQAELKNIANSISTKIHGMDSMFYENTTNLYLPNKEYNYKTEISTEYITIKIIDDPKDPIYYRHNIILKPFTRKDNSEWESKEELHTYLKNNYGNSGKIDDPIQNIDGVKNYLSDEYETNSYELAINPLVFYKEEKINFDKTFIIYETGEKDELIIIY